MVRGWILHTHVESSARTRVLMGKADVEGTREMRSARKED
jgi:hypothetical protein